MKKLQEARTKTSNKNVGQPSLFAKLAAINSRSIFNAFLSEDDKSDKKFVKPILASDKKSVAFFDANLTAQQIKAIVDNGFTTQELAEIDDLQEFGIVCCSEKNDIIELLQLSQKVHELRFWVDNKQLHIYCQIGAHYSYTAWDI